MQELMVLNQKDKSPRDIIYRIKPPFYYEDGVRLEFILVPGEDGNNLFQSILSGIYGDIFDHYLNGFLHPHNHTFSTLRRYSPWQLQKIRNDYHNRFILQERNHLPQRAQSVAFFYYLEQALFSPYLHLYDQVLIDIPRVRAILDPWCYSLDETIEEIRRAKTISWRRY